MVKELNLTDILGSINSESVKERDIGFADLKHALELQRKKNGVEDFRDKTIHLIFEALFNAASREYSNYEKATKVTVRSTSATRLTTCASTIRSTTVLLLPRIRLKTLRSFLAHVIQILTHEDGGLGERWSDDYVKCLNILLEYQPHVEHILQDDWCDVVDFCLKEISIFQISASELEDGSDSISASRSSNLSSQRRVNRTTDSQTISVNHKLRENVYGLLHCLQCLTATAGVPIPHRFRQLFIGIVDFLSASRTMTSAHVSAFCVLNATLRRISLTDANFMRNALVRLLPVVHGLWRVRNSALRDQLLHTLIVLLPHLQRTKNEMEKTNLTGLVSALFSEMRTEFLQAELRDRRRLSIDDLSLSSPDVQVSNTSVMSSLTFSLRFGNLSAEYGWTQLSIMGRLISWLDSRTALSTERSDPLETSHDSRKRHKPMPSFAKELFIEAIASSPPERTQLLQTLLFAIRHQPSTVTDLQDYLGIVLDMIRDQDKLVSSWACLIAAELTTKQLASSIHLRSIWSNIYHTAWTYIVSASHCRSVCHLLASLLRRRHVFAKDVTPLFERMLASTNLNSPAYLCDASIHLWVLLIESASTSQNLSEQCRQGFIDWILVKWQPSNFENRYYAHQLSTFVAPRDLLYAFDKLYDIHPEDRTSCGYKLLGDFGKEWNMLNVSGPLCEYLFLQEQTESISLGPQNKKPTTRPFASNTSKAIKRFPPFLLSESTRVLENLDDAIVNGSHTLISEMVQAVGQFCLVSSLLPVCLDQDHMAEHLSKNIHKIFEALCNHLAHRKVHQTVVDDFITTIALILPDIAHTVAVKETTNYLSEGLQKLLSIMVPMLDTRQSQAEAIADDDLAQFDDMNPISESQHRYIGQKQRQTNGHDDVTSLIPFKESFTCHVKCIKILNDHFINGTSASAASGTLISLLTELPAARFLNCKAFMQLLFQSDYSVPAEQVVMLLDSIKETLLSEYDFERAEAAIDLCLRVMNGSLHLWCGLSESPLSQDGADLYNWFVDNFAACSPKVQTTFSDLLSALLDVSPDFGRSSTRPSVRTTLLTILKESELPVQFHIARNVPRIFGKYVLSQHEIIFDDVHEALPRDETQAEGIALRLFILTELSSKWRTLLRRCVYHIFETAGLIPKATGHAKWCLDKLAFTYKLKNSKKILELFKGQLLFTWLDKDHANQSLANIPFAIFDFDDIRDLLVHVKSEVVSQVVIHNNDEHVKRLEKLLERGFSELVTEAFGQTMAYVLARDASAKEPDQSRRFEVRVRDLIGQARYAEHLQKQIAMIIGHCVNSIHGEDQIGKYLSKRDGFEEAAETFATIKNLGWPNNELAPAQQPSSKSRHLPDILSRLARRLQKDPRMLWTPQHVVIITRMILDSLSTTLGSLNSRRVVTRLAILASLASQTVNKGYALQQLLHGLRPLISDQECANEARCLVQHLLVVGQESLRVASHYMLGTVLTLQLSLKSFIKRPRDQNILEAEHEETTGQMKEFQTWLSKFDENLLPKPSPDLSESTIRTYRQILKVARVVEADSNATVGSNEGVLLKVLLSDMRTSRPSFSPMFRKLCFELFCRNFTAPKSLDDDIFGSEVTAERYMSNVWQSCTQYHVPDTYLQWACRALGRAFSHSGQLVPSMASESQLKRHSLLSRVSQDLRSSEAAIYRCVVEHLEAHDQDKLGAIEETLRRLFRISWSQSETDLLNGLANGFLEEAFSNINSAQDYNPFAFRKSTSLQTLFSQAAESPHQNWAQQLTVLLCQSAAHGSVLSAILPAIEALASLANQVLPFVMHLALQDALTNSSATLMDELAESINHLFSSASNSTIRHCRVVIECVLYLLTQPVPGELTRLDRSKWLERIKYEPAAKAAVQCRMFRTATFLLENSLAKSGNVVLSELQDTSQRNDIYDLLLTIYEQIDEPDSYYGIEQASNFQSLASRLEFEGRATESLMLRGTEVDSRIRSGRDMSTNLDKVVTSLSAMNLNSLTQQIGASLGTLEPFEPKLSDSLARSALRLQRWDISVGSSENFSSTLVYKTLQSLAGAESAVDATQVIDRGLLDLMSRCRDSQLTEALRISMTGMYALTNIHDLLRSDSATNLTSCHQSLRDRDTWMSQSSFDTASLVLSCRESFFNIMTKNSKLATFSAGLVTAQHLNELHANLHSSRIYRDLGMHQYSLANVVYLANTSDQLEAEGVMENFSIQLETARVLWDGGEQTPSIRMLRGLVASSGPFSSEMELGRAGLLAQLAHSTSEARLENPEDIMNKYLKEAHRELGDLRTGAEAGRVFHEFATYCHNQLVNPDFVAEFERSEKFRREKRKELQELDNLSKGKMTDQEKHKLRSDKSKVKKWLLIDDQDYKRLKENRNQFLRQSLEGYLMSLSAWDEQDSDVLRFFAIWLQHSTEDNANSAVENHIGRVPSAKFVQLMNQLASRLQDSETKFQSTMINLIIRICGEHPYHGMHHIFAGSRIEGGNDSTARSRHAAAVKIARRLTSDSKTANSWNAVSQSNELFIKAASVKTDEMKQGAKLRLRNFNATRALEKEIPLLKVPPITMHIPLRHDLDYSDVATIASFQSHLTIAGGISNPKIVTAISTAGTKHVQLYKAGSDDLRQDAIMEQVFEQVNGLLKSIKTTQQRNLGIRTYKVVPLNANAGAIEFVSNTISLNDYLNDAHVRYHPSDLKWTVARRKIDGAKELKLPARVQAYRDVATRFSPVLRHFFFENFEDPDDWFATRLAYTRSTAAISILGYILGLGDRHCQNILLDRTTGEAVHIDLGVAFEAGRILNIPEVVPFRLTRDIVDGFGITGTEGVFRRCCEFTLEALRKNKDAIMTILNVLRYDPLYSWSVSPLRAKRLQQEQERDAAAMTDTLASVVPGTSMASRTRASTRASAGQDDFRDAAVEAQEALLKTGAGAIGGATDESGGEADRALSVVERKLAAGLSVQAAVHELIQQATDEKNLAVLFCGWAAFA